MMSFSRRGIFGLFASAPAAVVAAQVDARENAPAPEFFVGQIRAVHSHSVVGRALTTALGGDHTHALTLPSSSQHVHSMSMTAGALYEAVAIFRYEQWDGEKWRPIGGLTP